MLILLGDMNSQVGREIAAFQGTIGKHSVHKENNDNGIRMTTMAIENNLVIGGTLFPHKKKHKATWLSSDGNTTNQIVHIIVRRKYRRSLLEARAYKGADRNSDHFLLIAKARMKLTTKRTQTARTERVNVEKLQNEQERIQYQIEVENCFSISEGQDEELSWNQVGEVVKRAARETLGVTPVRRKKRWFDAACAEAADRMKRASVEWLTDKDNEGMRLMYWEARNRASRTNRNKKKEAIGRKLGEIERSGREKRTRVQFQGIISGRKDYQPRQGLICDKNGEFLMNRIGVENRWIEHFEETLNRLEPQHPLSNEEVDDGFEEQMEQEEPPTAREIIGPL